MHTMAESHGRTFGQPSNRHITTWISTLDRAFILSLAMEHKEHYQFHSPYYTHLLLQNHSLLINVATIANSLPIPMKTIKDFEKNPLLLPNTPKLSTLLNMYYLPTHGFFCLIPSLYLLLALPPPSMFHLISIPHNIPPPTLSRNPYLNLSPSPLQFFLPHSQDPITSCLHSTSSPHCQGNMHSPYHSEY
jgi:hypothetical protein